jgi:peptidoglycan L-alanyl-D-glutamate endopeptidase CwlK
VFRFGLKSVKILEEVQPHLRSLATKVISISPIDFAITSGLRTLEEQQTLYKQGKSKTLNSKHLTGQAIDFVPWHSGAAHFEDINSCCVLAGIFLAVARESLCTKIRVGALWNHNLVLSNTFLDAYHVELVY